MGHIQIAVRSSLAAAPWASPTWGAGGPHRWPASRQKQLRAVSSEEVGGQSAAAAGHGRVKGLPRPALRQHGEGARLSNQRRPPVPAGVPRGPLVATGASACTCRADASAFRALGKEPTPLVDGGTCGGEGDGWPAAASPAGEPSLLTAVASAGSWRWVLPTNHSPTPSPGRAPDRRGAPRRPPLGASCRRVRTRHAWRQRRRILLRPTKLSS